VPNTCSICKHPKHRTIDAELVRGTSYRDIAGRFSVSSSAVERHMSHVAATVAKKRDAADDFNADLLVTELRELRRETLDVLERAKAMPEGGRLVLHAVQRLEKQAELLLRFLGELNERTVVHSSTFDEDWLRMRAVLVKALSPYPAAAAAVLSALAAAGDRLA
jgi:transposase